MKDHFFKLKSSAVILGSCVLLASPAFAAKTGEVKITGSVPVSCDITVQQESGAVGIPDISIGATNRAVAIVTESCNSQSGYRVSLTTTNGKSYTGLFVDTASGDKQPFTINYGGTTVTQSVVTDSAATASGLQKPVTISYAANPKLTGTTSATYTETLTFTISAR